MNGELPMPSPTPTVRPAHAEDLPFVVRSNLGIAAETEGLVLDPATVTRGVQAVLSDPSKGLYLVAEYDGGAVGQLLVTYEYSDWRAAWWYWIQSVYVLPAARRHGVYRALHAAVLDLARNASEPVCGVKLYVDRNNAAAQATYSALGMAQSHYRLWEQPLTGEVAQDKRVLKSS